MQNSRQKILQYIIEQQNTTVEELSKVFRVTPANIRHHLSILTEQGSVKVIGLKAVSEKGRPAQIYCASQLSDQNNLGLLSDALLRTLMCKAGPNERHQFIEDIANQLGSHFKTGFSNPTRRLYSTIHALNHMNYQAHWEAHLENPRIMLGHCPYHAILEIHPELCLVDASLLEQLLGAPVRQVEMQTNNIRGIPQCVFIIKKPE
jgi:predicted ArsR family transcriptional regulator